MPKCDFNKVAEQLLKGEISWHFQRKEVMDFLMVRRYFVRQRYAS